MAEYRRFYDNVRARLVGAMNSYDEQWLKDEIAFCKRWGEPLLSMAVIAEAALPLLDGKTPRTPPSPQPVAAAKSKRKSRQQDNIGRSPTPPPAVAGGWTLKR